MRFLKSDLANLAAVMSLILSAASASGYTVTNLVTSTGNPKANNTINFHVLDSANYSNNSNTTCEGSWAPTSSPPTSWQPCTNNTFAWMFGDFEGDGAVGSYINGSTFGLSIQHSYIDPALGPPPYNVITTFGRGQVNSTVVNCVKNYSSTECNEKLGSTFDVRVVAATG